jgi:hypothetical protein
VTDSRNPVTAVQPTTARYRLEHNVPAIDIMVSRIEQLFDHRDPAPFRERDLDPGLVEYLVACAEDLVGSEQFRIVFWLDQLEPAKELEAACRAHFSYEVMRIDRRRRRQRRAGWVTLFVALLSIIALVSLGEAVAHLVKGSVGTGLKEGFVISGWVLMWRPIEVLVYDGILWRRDRRVLQRLFEAPIELRKQTSTPLLPTFP